jgi:energy-coupling factor transport system ATP-binding protein
VREGREFLRARFTTAPFVPAGGAREDGQAGASLALEVKNLWFRYEKRLPDVLEGVALQLRAGEQLCVLGGNGSGKTTLLKAISAQERAYRGSVRVLGKKLAAYKAGSLYRDTLALLPQDPQSMFLKSTLRDDYADLCGEMGLDRDEGRRRAAEVAGLLDIAHLLGRHPYDLSGGEQQKAALGKVLLLRPRVLLMDEPTKGIDAWGKLQLGRILRDLRGRGVSILTVTHDVEFAAANAQRCALLFDGQLCCVDETRAFFSGNQFYTTAAIRIARHTFPGAATVPDVLAACAAQGGGGAP